MQISFNFSSLFLVERKLSLSGFTVEIRGVFVLMLRTGFFEPLAFLALFEFCWQHHIFVDATWVIRIQAQHWYTAFICRSYTVFLRCSFFYHILNRRESFIGVYMFVVNRIIWKRAFFRSGFGSFLCR